jgi:hypothetical protein
MFRRLCSSAAKLSPFAIESFYPFVQCHMSPALSLHINHLISVSGALPHPLRLTPKPHNLTIVIFLHSSHAILSFAFALDTAGLLLFVLDSTLVTNL